MHWACCRLHDAQSWIPWAPGEEHLVFVIIWGEIWYLCHPGLGKSPLVMQTGCITMLQCWLCRLCWVAILAWGGSSNMTMMALWGQLQTGKLSEPSRIPLSSTCSLFSLFIRHMTLGASCVCATSLHGSLLPDCRIILLGSFREGSHPFLHNKWANPVEKTN